MLISKLNLSSCNQNQSILGGMSYNALNLKSVMRGLWSVRNIKSMPLKYPLRRSHAQVTARGFLFNRCKLDSVVVRLLEMKTSLHQPSGCFCVKTLPKSIGRSISWCNCLCCTEPTQFLSWVLSLCPGMLFFVVCPMSSSCHFSADLWGALSVWVSMRGKPPHKVYHAHKAMDICHILWFRHVLYCSDLIKTWNFVQWWHAWETWFTSWLTGTCHSV